MRKRERISVLWVHIGTCCAVIVPVVQHTVMVAAREESFITGSEAPVFPDERKGREGWLRETTPCGERADHCYSSAGAVPVI